jgi:PGF-CTERM protein
VTDTEASSNASVNVSEAGEGDVAFENDVPQDQIGDVTNVTVQMENTDDATITIGSEDQNYWVVAQVTDDDDDGEVTVAFNSYLAGSDAADSDVLTDATGEDDVTVLSQGGQFYTDNQGAAPYQSLLDATEYEMNVSVGHNAIGSDAWQDADDVGSLSYQERSTDNLSIMTTPSDFSDWEEDVIVAGLGSNVTQTDEIATGDYAVVQLEASGLEGYLESAGETDFLTGNATTLVVEEADPGANADAETIQLDSNDVEVVADANNNTYYVAMPSDAGNFEETEYTAEFTVYDEMQGGPNEGDDNVLNFDEDDEDETVASNFDVVEPEVNLDMNEDDMVLVEAAENQTVSGTANIAPGTELTIEIESDDSTSPFLTRPEATVQPDGTFNASADFSDLSEGTNLTLTIDDYDVEEDGQVVSEGELGGDENVTETETETVTETETDTETEMDTETEADDGDTETDTEASPTDDSGPGFTVVAALGALIAAALLAVRRNN